MDGEYPRIMEKAEELKDMVESCGILELLTISIQLGDNLDRLMEGCTMLSKREQSDIGACSVRKAILALEELCGSAALKLEKSLPEFFRYDPAMEEPEALTEHLLEFQEAYGQASEYVRKVSRFMEEWKIVCRACAIPREQFEGYRAESRLSGVRGYLRRAFRRKRS